MLDDAAHRFYKSPPPPVLITDEEINATYPNLPERSTSVIAVYSRIRPVPLGASRLNKAIGRDYLWILASDVRAIVNADGFGTFTMPRDLTARITRFHLIDNVRGEPDMWQPSHIRKAVFTMKRLKAAGNLRTYSFHGDFEMKYPDGSRGQRGSIDGEVEINAGTLRVQRFRAFSKSEAWGESKFTKHAPAGKFPLLIAMKEAEGEAARNVPPEAVSRQEDYVKPRFLR